MRKGINDVRRSISRRSKMRREKVSQSRERWQVPLLGQEEEKHGYIPTIHTEFEPNEESSTLFRTTIVKIALSVLLFFGVAFLARSNAPLFAVPKEWTRHVLMEEFPFARVNVWYQETFGKPLSLIPQSTRVVDQNDMYALPVLGNVTETFQVNGSGIMISPEKSTSVAAWQEGIVIFAGNDRKRERTVIIQHADNSKSTYALLSTIDVHLYQYVSENQVIGTFDPTEANDVVYFSIEQKNEYIDPVQVIRVDDIP